MKDLFGQTATAPTGACAPVQNAAYGFTEFWEAWPKGPRKVARQQCLNKWAKYGCADITDEIVKHVEAMTKSNDWLKDNGAYIPAPLVYLNQQRWEGYVAPPQAAKVQDMADYFTQRDKASAKPSFSVRQKISSLLGLTR